MLALGVAALALAGPAAAGTGMFVGAAEDDARSLDPLTTKAKMDLAAIAGLGTIRMTVIWSPGETAVGGDDLAVLQNASTAAQFDGIRLIVSIYPRDRRTTPLNSRSRGEFAEFAASIARTFPGISDFIVGNEPNLNLFWMPQFGPSGRDLGAPAYELLLAKTYDALKSVSPEVNVIGGALSPRGQDKRQAARQTHSPTAFIADLGAAYRLTRRTRPIMDMFAIHPYLIPSRLPPTFAHPNTTTIGIADYPKLVALLTRAFAKTGQPGATLPIIYDEFGYQSIVPVAKRPFYSHLGTPAAKDAITEPRQALYYRQAIALVACQPTVAGLLIFHVVDERDANAWQSGVYYADGTPKTSLDGVRQSALAARDGTLGDCAQDKTVDPFESVAFRIPPPAPAPLRIEVGCTVGCTYTARVIDLSDGLDVAHAEGEGSGLLDIALPSEAIPTGLYQYALRVSTVGKPGTAVTRLSEPFTIESAPLPPTPPPDPAVDPPPPTPEPTLASLPIPLLPLTASLPTLVPLVP